MTIKLKRLRPPCPTPTVLGTVPFPSVLGTVTKEECSLAATQAPASVSCHCEGAIREQASFVVLRVFLFKCVAFLCNLGCAGPKRLAFMKVDRAPVVHGPAYRRRMRHLRSSWRHEQLSLRMQMGHPSFQRAHRVDQGVRVGAPWVHDFEMSEPSDDSAVIEYVAAEPAVTSTAPAPVIEHVPPNLPETVEMLGPHGRVQPQTIEHVLPNFFDTIKMVSFAPDTTPDRRTRASKFLSDRRNCEFFTSSWDQTCDVFGE